MGRQDSANLNRGSSGNVGYQPRDFSVGHVTVGTFPLVFVESLPSDIAQREETNKAAILVERR
jgi:hypothetical protein